MFALHASMPALSPAALRRFDLCCCLAGAVLSGAVAWLLGPGRWLVVCVSLGSILIFHLAVEVALRHWARRRALHFIPRRQWQAAWQQMIATAPLVSILARAMLLGFVAGQVEQVKPVWEWTLQNLPISFGSTVGVVFGASLTHRCSTRAKCP